MTNFNEFLREKHMAQYLGPDDGADDFDDWMGDLSDEDLEKYAEGYLQIESLNEPH